MTGKWKKAAAAGLLAACVLFSTRPGKGREERMRAFRGYIAHRGLHDMAAGCPENSMPAFRRAADAGFGIELDVRLTKDGVPVVVHDEDLFRMAGVRRKVADMELPELLKCRLAGTEERVPLLSEVLKTVGGRVPLIIELKAEVRCRELCERVTALLDRYPGKYCIESFSPAVLWWFRQHRPLVLRGQLSTDQWKEGNRQWWYADPFLKWCAGNFLTRPDFVAYNLAFRHTLPVFVLSRLWKAEMAAWTVRSREELEACRKYCSIFIFEGFLPEKT